MAKRIIHLKKEYHKNMINFAVDAEAISLAQLNIIENIMKKSVL